MSRGESFISTENNLTLRTSDAAFAIYVQSFTKLRMQSSDLKTRIEETKKRHGIVLDSKNARQTAAAREGNEGERS